MKYWIPHFSKKKVAQIDYVCVLCFNHQKVGCFFHHVEAKKKKTQLSRTVGVMNPGYLKLERAGKIQQALIMKFFFQLPKNIMSWVGIESRNR